MFGNSIRIGSVFGIDIRIDVSWLVIALLIAWSFFAEFTSQFPQLSGAAAAALAAATAGVFFASVLAHELSHSVMARRLGIPVGGITLFLFGGVTETRMEAREPRSEFLVAIVGPLTSLVLGGVFWVLVNGLDQTLPDATRFALGRLGWINAALAVFNLLPGFPLDGGRVLRAFLWRTTGSLTRATRGAARGGQMVGAGLIGLGILEVFLGNLGGLWMAAIGWFLYQAAFASGQDVVMRRMLRQVAAGDLMSPNPVSIPAELSIAEAVDDFFLRYDHSAFPVEDEDGTAGLITLRAVRQIPRDQWERRQVWSAMTRLEDLCTVPPHMSMDQVLERLRSDDIDRVLVMEDGRAVGIITPRDVARWVHRSEELGISRQAG